MSLVAGDLLALGGRNPLECVFDAVVELDDTVVHPDTGLTVEII